MRTKRCAVACGLLAAAVLPLTPVARGDALSFGSASQTAYANDDAAISPDQHTKPGFGANSAMTSDGDGFSGFGDVTVDQSLGFDNPTRTLSASAQVSASATGPAFGGDFTATGRANYTVNFTLSGPQDLIFMDSGGESALTGPNNTNIPPGSVLAQAGDYTLAGSALAIATGSDGATQRRNSSFNVTLQFVIPGDTNQDGKVNFTDLLALAQHYGHQNASLSDGDFNLDGSVGFNDLLLLAQNYGQMASPQAVALAAVPEPVGLGLLAIAPLLVRRSRR